MYVCEQARRPACDSAIEFFLFNFACIRTSLHSYFFLSFSRWMSVPVFGYILIHCMSIYVFGSCLFLSFSLNICNNDRLYYHLLYVYMSIAWSVFLSLCLSLSLAISIFGYIVTDCNSIGTSLDRRVSLFFLLCLSVSAYGYIIGNYACIGTSVDSSFFLTFRLNVFTSVRLYYHSL